jgi:coenzyme F420 hydrogenase subunit beta
MSKRLEMEVWSQNKCSGCGLCVAACSKQVLEWGESSHPNVSKREKTVGYSRTTLDSCSFCQKFCEEVCPRLENWKPIPSRQITAARAQGPVRSGTPDDVIRAILAAGRSAGLLDGVVMLDLDRWQLKPISRVAETIEDIVDSVGMQYLWAPVFDGLNEAVFERRMENIAIVSTPCAAQAVRKLRTSGNSRLKPYQDAIRLSIAMFCSSIFFPGLIGELLVSRMGLATEQIKRIEVAADREKMDVVLWDGTQHSINRQQAEAFTRPGCASCDDYLGESADIATGTLGAPDGFSTLIIRSPSGDVFSRNAVQMGLLETIDSVDEMALIHIAEEKDRRQRAQAIIEMRVLVMDALSDPLQRGEAIKQFVRLYRTPSRPGTLQSKRNGCTGC